METFYLVIVLLLFGLAISDLIVGVSNDAVNFLNSAIGSRAAPFRIIMLIAALGVLVGATFSSGMMEVARKGIFHPGQFYFNEIMIIFLAVMITDVILLDLFNTFGLPTSTTVSIVFELLGAAVGMTIIKISNSPEGINELGTYINSGSALLIISGILLSVFIAFTVGAIVQFLSRIIFSFDYSKTIKWFGSIWSGMAITAITYFILLKGASGSSFITEKTLILIQQNMTLILFGSFVFWTLFMQILIWVFRINIFKLVIMVGTFALAMAFAGNDLVNFIGVPLAGYESFKAYSVSTGFSPDSFLMDSLQEQVKTPTFFLLIAGIIMVITLWVSRKARSVVKTTLNLSNQDIVNERFESSLLARSIVRQSIYASNWFKSVIPKRMLIAINKRFDPTFFKKASKKGSGISFDMIRASVNLVVASILIAFATSFKLPLSTTYVTFMVAMGTSLADGAWDRESAVYRITGVITVIGGWFFTALSAFTVAFTVALIINWLGLYGLIGLVLLAAFFAFKTHALHIFRSKEEEKLEKVKSSDLLLNSENIYTTCNQIIISTLVASSALYKQVVNGLIAEKRKKIKKGLKEIKKLNKEVKSLKNNIHNIIKRLEEEESVESGHYYVQIIDYLREIAHCMTFIAEPSFKHVDNNHTPLVKAQARDLSDFANKLQDYFEIIITILSSNNFSDIDKSTGHMYSLVDNLTKMRKKQIKQIKKESLNTRSSLLYLDILAETRNLLLYTNNLVKAARDFVEYKKLGIIRKASK